MHPRMGEMIGEMIVRLREERTEVVVLEAALLVEAGWGSLVDEIWVTYSPEDKVIERLRGRNELPEEEIRSRISSQLPFEDTSQYAHVVVWNSGGMDELREKVESLWSSRVKGKVS